MNFSQTVEEIKQKHKILCTGNPNKPGISAAVKRAFPHANFMHLSEGTDLLTEKGILKFKNSIKHYNVFINVSQLKNGIQEELVKIAYCSGMQGHVFSIGSIAEYQRWQWFDPQYSREKLKLRETSLDLCTELFKTTHIVAGGFQDYTSQDPTRMTPDIIVQLISHILSLDINIPIIGIEKIINDDLEKKLKGQ